MAKWNDDWRDELNEVKPYVMTRLAECRSLKKDIPILASAMWNYNTLQTPEDCLIRVIEWLGENNQFFDLTDDEYNDFLFDVSTSR